MSRTKRFAALGRGGVYLFTVPHFRDRPKTLDRVVVADPDDVAKDEYPWERQYHLDGNSTENQALVYREYGRDIDEMLRELGFHVEYSNKDFPEAGIMRTELFYCRVL